MGPLEIVEAIRSENPNLLGGVDSKVAARAIKGFIDLLNNELSASQDGVFKINGLGTFRVKMVKQEKDGDEIDVKRIILRLSGKNN